MADPLLDLINGSSAAPAAPGGQDPLLQLVGVPTSSAAASQQASPAVAASTLPQTINGKQWQAPGGFLMGMGDTLKGALETGLHGAGWLADKFAPGSEFANSIHDGINQLAQTSKMQEASYQAKRASQGQSGFDGARATGNIVSTAPLMLTTPEFGGTGVTGIGLRGAISGAENALVTPTADPAGDFASQKASQIGLGAITGAIAPTAMNTVGRVISPQIGAAQQRLLAAGVPLTPGQIMGGGFARTEEKLSSIPFLGDMIKNAQQRSIQGFNRATYNDALAPIGAQLPADVATGSQAVGAVNNAIGDVYRSIEPRAQFVVDNNFGQDVNAIRAGLEQNAPGVVQQFDNILHNQVLAKAAANNGVLDGAQWGATRSTINGIARNQITGNSTPDNRMLADALGDLNDAINAGVGRSSPPEILQTLQRANQAWARYKQIEGAAGMAGASNNGNVFTAAQYANAVRRGATSAQRAQNSGLNGGLAADAQDVLGAKYPDSGTPGRALIAMMGPAALGHAMAPQVVVPTAAAVGLGSLPYTRVGQQAAQAILTGGQGVRQPIADLLTRYLSPIAPIAFPSLVNSDR